MKVKAIQNGYFNHKRVYEGDIFELEKESEFSKKWMVLVDEEDVTVKLKKPKRHGVSQEVEQEA